jgi:F420-0:gamma-glutamyl ligase-like protein
MIFANAYTNAIAGMTASGTLQYALDAATDALVTLANNDGTLMTVAPVTVEGMAADLSGMGGFDIVSPEEGTDMAYAVLQMEGGANAGLYAIDLSTGAASMLADLGMGGITGFAVSMSAM